jgi:hypothetical protein
MRPRVALLHGEPALVAATRISRSSRWRLLFRPKPLSESYNKRRDLSRFFDAKGVTRSVKVNYLDAVGEFGFQKMAVGRGSNTILQALDGQYRTAFARPPFANRYGFQSR